jgi:hypothetical protein
MAASPPSRGSPTDNETLLVPRVPEAKTDDEDLNAVVTFTKAVETWLKERVS